MNPSAASEVGIVVIGRNEGERLKRCMQSINLVSARVVYVDSGSTDGSAAWAKTTGAEVVDLDMSLPFTAARARNAGVERLRLVWPQVGLVQFVDGDCELAVGWLAAASAHLLAHSEVAVVCGRLRERHPEVSVYNQLCDVEWNTPVGEARACGGVAMMRVDALAAVNGFENSLIAGEEPELCVRLRAAGWRVWRLVDEMGWHDAAMRRFGQWWRRMRRAGFAFAQGSALHGTPPEWHFVVETRRAAVWGLWLPVLTVGAAAIHPAGAVLAVAYPLQVLRLAVQRLARGDAVPWAQAFFLVLGRLPEGLGVAGYWWSRWRKLPARLIEYK
jgi:glycosyltransferase involved in cell wall biosynthesis